VLEEELHERSEGHQHGGMADDEHDHAAPGTTPGSSGQPAPGHVDSAVSRPHSHPPGTPPHQD
jgi:hypothetical protein